MEIFASLAVNLAVLLLVFLAAWLGCWKIRDCTPVDSLWAIGMVAVALSSLAQAGALTQRRLLLTGLCAVWGLRLGGYLLWRWRDHGPDRRYVRLMEKARDKQGWGYGQASLRLVFVVQWPLLWLVCLPIQLGQIDAQPESLGPLGLFGAALAVFGIAFESLADWQLVRFKRDSATAGQVLDRGLWRYTRHPNYFGDACVWWGLFCIAAETRTGLFSVAGPALLTWTLMRWSGAPTVENRMRKTRPGYVDYIRRTSGFVPWPPKREIGDA